MKPHPIRLQIRIVADTPEWAQRRAEEIARVVALYSDVVEATVETKETPR